MTHSVLSPLLTVLSIPSPPAREFLLFGVIPIRFYALCIISGVIVGVVIATRRWMARGGSRDAVETVALVSVPFGIVGARLYHVITDHQLYFGPGKIWYHAFFIWDGGLGIWGGVALGAVGGYLVARRRNIRFWALADALAPGVAVAQAIGRLGNWFNQELYGGPTKLPWGLQIAPEYRLPGYEQYATFQPTFLYELIWDLCVAGGVILLDRRFKLGHGKVFTLYVMFYTIGRAWVEHLRIDPAHHIDGFRINDYVSVIVFLASLIIFLWQVRHKHGREPIVEGDFVFVKGLPPTEAADDTASTDDSGTDDIASPKDAASAEAGSADEKTTGPDEKTTGPDESAAPEKPADSSADDTSGTA